PPVVVKPTRPRTIKAPIRVAPVTPAPTVAEPVPAEPPKPAVSAGSLVSRGTDLAIHGKLQPAREAFEAAIATEPTNAAAHRGLGIVYQRTGAAAQAIAAYRRYLELRPDAQDAAVIQDRITSLGGTR